MKGLHYLGTTVLALGITATAPTTPVTAAPGVSADITVETNQVTLHEAFPILVSIQARELRLSQTVDVLAMPAEDILEVGTFKPLPSERRVVDGSVIDVRRYRAIARAHRVGPLNLEPVFRVRVLTRVRGIFGSTWQETPRTLKPERVPLEVIPHPTEGRPDTFSGAVGSFQFDVTVAPTHVAAGDLVPVTMHIRGDGYVEGLRVPRLSSSAELKAYPPRPLDPQPEDLLTFEQVVVPRTDMVRNIPAVEFSYFNPDADRYKRIRRGPFPLHFHARRAGSFERFRPGRTNTEPSPGRTCAEGSHPPVFEHAEGRWWQRDSSATVA